MHVGKLTNGRIKLGDAVEMRVEGSRRAALRRAHSATHLLHEALRRRLGAHVTQKGSLVAPDRLRFDFSHPKALTAEDLRAVEAEVNARARRNADVATRYMTPDEAVAAGALALFGEKYGDEVRVVSMGGADATESGERSFSTELCGGTHVSRTGDIGLFKAVGEGAVAAGVRRIEALTGAAAEAHVAEQEQLMQKAAAALKALPAELPARVAALMEEKRRLERELAETRKAMATGGSRGNGATETRQVGGVSFVARKLDDVPARELKSIADDLKKQLGSGVVAIVGTHDGKAANVVAVTSDLTDRFDAVKLVKIGVAELGGQGGGGRPDMAQGGGPNAAHADAALAAIEKAVAAA